MATNAEPVKRAYKSSLREAHARTTRRAIVGAAATLFLERGYGATTIDAIAEAAGVNRKTVFTSVGGKFQALKLAIDWANVGDDEPVPMLERPHVKAAMQEPDARRILQGFAHDIRLTGQRTAPLYAVLDAASGLDPELRALSDDLRGQRLRGMTSLAQQLAKRDALKQGLTPAEAADVLWLLIDHGVYTRLVVQQGWSPGRFEEWLAEAMMTLLIAPDYRPKPPRGASSVRSQRRE